MFYSNYAKPYFVICKILKSYLNNFWLNCSFIVVYSHILLSYLAFTLPCHEFTGYDCWNGIYVIQECHLLANCFDMLWLIVVSLMKVFVIIIDVMNMYITFFLSTTKEWIFAFVSSLTLKHILLIELEITFLILLPKLPARWQNFPKRCIKWRQHYMEIPLIWNQILFSITSFYFIHG